MPRRELIAVRILVRTPVHHSAAVALAAPAALEVAELRPFQPAPRHVLSAAYWANFKLYLGCSATVICMQCSACACSRTWCVGAEQAYC